MFLLTKEVVAKGEEFNQFVRECIHRFNKGDYGDTDKAEKSFGYALAVYDYKGEKVVIELINEVATVSIDKVLTE